MCQSDSRTVLLCMLLAFPLLISATSLDDYVWKDDGHYSYVVVKNWTRTFGDHTTYVINMTSQKWLTDDDTLRSLWWHYLLIHVPKNVDPDLVNSAYFLVNNGKNSDPEVEPTDFWAFFTGLIADSTKSVVAELRQIPNQPVTFKGDPKKKSRHEDGLMAYSWRHFLDNPQKPEWLIWFPMTKAAVKGMDTVTDFLNKTFGQVIDSFCVGGASKRGWIAWLTGAVDYKRVKCITPMVMDELNLVKNLHHHYRAYGGWSFALKPYHEQNITARLDELSMVSFAALVDPISYVDRLKMPKLVISSGGDEFFLPDDSHYYLKSMKRATYVDMLPNADHTCLGHLTQARMNIQAFYVSVMKKFSLPKVSWSLYSTQNGGGIDVKTDRKPSMIRAWSVTSVSSKRRDFRLLCGNPNNPDWEPIVQLNVWFKSDVIKIENLVYRARFDNPISGRWKAFFIQMEFLGSDGIQLEMTTETNIIPNTFPFPDCHMESCRGIIV